MSNKTRRAVYIVRSPRAAAGVEDPAEWHFRRSANAKAFADAATDREIIVMSVSPATYETFAFID